MRRRCLALGLRPGVSASPVGTASSSGGTTSASRLAAEWPPASWWNFGRTTSGERTHHRWQQPSRIARSPDKGCDEVLCEILNMRSIDAET